MAVKSIFYIANWIAIMERHFELFTLWYYQIIGNVTVYLYF